MDNDWWFLFFILVTALGVGTYILASLDLLFCYKWIFSKYFRCILFMASSGPMLFHCCVFPIGGSFFNLMFLLYVWTVWSHLWATFSWLWSVRYGS